MDIKHIARVLYENREDSDYSSDQGKWRLLAKNGVEIAKRTFERHIEEIKTDIANLHDIAFRESNKPNIKQELEKLFTQTEYVLAHKSIIESEPDSQGKYPSHKDRLQALKQLGEYFGWNAAKKLEIEGEFMQLFITGRFKTQAPEGTPNTNFKDL